MPIARSRVFSGQTKGDCFPLQKITSLLLRREVCSATCLGFKVRSSQEHFDLVPRNSRKNYIPLTVSERYSLFDRFHEKNSTSPSDLLRRVTLVPELNAVVNTEVEEQLHNSINRSNYSFNMMLPGNHLFMMRLKLHSSNMKINQGSRKKLETVFRAHLGPHTNLQSDERGILILQRTLFEGERHSRDSVMATTHLQHHINS